MLDLTLCTHSSYATAAPLTYALSGAHCDQEAYVMLPQTLPLVLDLVAHAEGDCDVSTHPGRCFLSNVRLGDLDYGETLDRMSHASPAAEVNAAIFSTPANLVLVLVPILLFSQRQRRRFRNFPYVLHFSFSETFLKVPRITH